MINGTAINHLFTIVMLHYNIKSECLLSAVAKTCSVKI